MRSIFVTSCSNGMNRERGAWGQFPGGKWCSGLGRDHK